MIALAYNGTVPLNEKLYTITKQLPHYAELAWREGVIVDEILQFLAGAPDLHLTTFDVRRPTLNEIFLTLYK